MPGQQLSNWVLGGTTVSVTAEPEGPVTHSEREVSVRAFWSDASKLAGLWSLWFIALMAITGVWYLLKFADLGFAYPELQPVDRAASRARLTTDELIKQAQKFRPELTVTQMYFLGGYYGAAVLQASELIFKTVCCVVLIRGAAMTTQQPLYRSSLNTPCQGH